jgi:hypothetical protein
MSEDRIVGHKTFVEGGHFRHEPLRSSEAERIMAAVEEAKQRRAEMMPTEKDAARLMWEAYYRLTELGWRDATYCPRDGRMLKFIEAGSSGIHDGHCDDQDKAHKRPTVWLHSSGDLWPSQPVLYRDAQGIDSGAAGQTPQAAGPEGQEPGREAVRPTDVAKDEQGQTK